MARLAAAADRPTPSHTPRQSIRKRVKLRVPAEKYPDYNFVGRLLGPRGATLKRLERDTGCRIMIRGKGSIRKDKEAEVRGKPGWEHVFHEPLHVVIEVADAADEQSANRILTRAKELVELLLVPVPEERDSLKRAQLRDLAILNGTHRSVPDLVGHPPLSSPRAPPASPPPVSRRPSHGMKHSSKSYNNSTTDSYIASLDSASGVSFARALSRAQYSDAPAPAQSPQPASSPRQHTAYPPSSSPMFPAESPRQSNQYLPDLEKLRIPSLDFDHLSETNITLNSLGMPAASPTIVDPEIYPYPQTPSLFNVDHQAQLNSFASPVWTPPRPMTSSLSGSSNGMPPRSPRAPDSNSQQSSAFLLGRPLGDPARGQGAFQRSASLREGALSFEEAFASHATVNDDREGRDFNGQPQFLTRDHTQRDRQSALADLFPKSSGLASHPASQSIDCERFELRQLSQVSSSLTSSREDSSTPTGSQLAHHQDELRADSTPLNHDVIHQNLQATGIRLEPQGN